MHPPLPRPRHDRGPAAADLRRLAARYSWAALVPAVLILLDVITLPSTLAGVAGGLAVATAVHWAAVMTGSVRRRRRGLPDRDPSPVLDRVAGAHFAALVLLTISVVGTLS